MAESLSLQRDYQAPPERVFEAWTDVELLRQRFGCGPEMLWNVHQWDVRVGGAIHMSLTLTAARSRSRASSWSSNRRAGSATGGPATRSST
jgi:uncharacterized protein YndB with AHSA1/START domain